MDNLVIKNKQLYDRLTIKRVKGFFLYFKTNVNFVLKNLAMTNPNSELIVELKDKINRLVQQYQSLKSEVQMLENEKDKLTSQLENASREYNNLEQRFNNLKITKDLVTGSSEAGETKKRIGQIVREIDKCIALLNR